jgi:hypothetical protein
MHSEAFMGVSAAVHFPSLLFSVTNSLITIASLHHHRNPLFSTKNGQNQFQVMKFFNFHPSISGVFNFTIASLDQPFQFHVFSISGAFNFTIASLDQPLVFNFHPSI